MNLRSWLIMAITGIHLAHQNPTRQGNGDRIIQSFWRSGPIKLKDAVGSELRITTLFANYLSGGSGSLLLCDVTWI